MNLKINETAKLTGVTVRTLHYYDKIGLLKPDIIMESGYRMYNEKNLEILQQILFFRELGFPLKDIKEILDNPEFDKMHALRKQKELLLKKRKRLDSLITLIDEIMQGGSAMSFKEFDMTEIKETMKEYAGEVKERWGSTDAYAECKKRTASYGKEKWMEINQDIQQIFSVFNDLNRQQFPPDCRQAKEAVRAWQEHISSNYYPCTDEILKSLGTMYTSDERFREYLDTFGEGTAEYISRAIEAY